ncbi:MAG: hypothetical protein M0T70_06585 [Geobacteraceae bacterium]|nr:hypothetical protein [Geobacteraceae bacterium]
MSPVYKSDYVLPILERAIAERNDERGIGGAVKVANELDTSESMISQLRGGTYPPSSSQKWYRKIVEKYGKETVVCPVVGEAISLDRCSRERERPYSTVNPTRRAFSQTCPTCERRH